MDEESAACVICGRQSKISDLVTISGVEGSAGINDGSPRRDDTIDVVPGQQYTYIRIVVDGGALIHRVPWPMGKSIQRSLHNVLHLSIQEIRKSYDCF